MRALFLLPLIALLAACHSSPPARAYRMAKGKFAIVAIQDAGASESDAEQAARELAARVTVKRGYRYYVVEKEGDVLIVRKEYQRSEHAIGNSYNEKFKDAADDAKDTVPAYRMVIDLYKKDPGRGAIDACEVVGCGK